MVMAVSAQAADAAANIFTLTPGNFADFARGLPVRAKMVLQAGMSLPFGSLTVQLPDGRTLIGNTDDAGTQP